MLGTALASTGLVPRFRLNSELVLAVFLPPLLFDAGFSMRAAAVRREWHWIVLFGLLGTVLAGAVVLAILTVAGFPLAEAVLLAAILAATDPVSVFAALRRLHTPERLRLALEGESLLNDGVAVVLFSVALSAVQQRAVGAAAVVGLFAWMTVGGIGIGTGLGFLMRFGLTRAPQWVQLGASLVAAYASFLLADLVHASGLLAVIAISLILGTAYQPGSHRLLHRSWRQLGFVMSGIVFLLVGLQVRLDQLPPLAARLLVVAVAILVGRTLMVLVITALRRDLWPWSWQVALVWAGLRGALSLALALSLPAEVAQQREILILSFGFIFISLVLQGLSTGLVFRALGITRQTAVTTVG